MKVGLSLIRRCTCKIYHGELQLNLFSDGGEEIQQIWHNSIDKQLELNQGFANNFFEVFRQLKVGMQ